MKKLLLTVFLLCFWAAFALAETWTPKDFAYGLPVRTDMDAPVALVLVPDDVYRHVFRPDLGDMRVFNHKGTIVPHMIRKAEGLKPDGVLSRSLPIFPLPAREKQDDGYRVHVRTDASGAVVDIIQGTGNQSRTLPAAAYLLDASALKRPLRKLTVIWDSPDQGFLSKISISASDDLENWHSVKKGVALADLRYEGERLVRNTVSLPRKQRRYLRINWEDATGPVAITDVKTEVYQNRKSPLRKERLVDAAFVDKEKGVYEFETGGFYPISAVQVKFRQANTMARGVLKSRLDPDATWRVRYSGLFYSLTMKDTVFESKPAVMGSVADSYWRLEIDPAGGEAPQLVIGYQPQELLFVAQGEAPFTLAFGSAAVTPADAPMNSLLKSMRKKDRDDFVRTASLGKRITLGGEQQFARSWKTVDWKRWLLWSVMICGVLLIGIMAWRLYSKMNEDAKG